MSRFGADDESGTPICDDERDALLSPCIGSGRLLLAVSGGSDSMALLHLVAEWHETQAADRPRPLVATIDHGLRPGSAGEAAWVGDRARDLGLEHRTLAWTGPKPATGIQEAARKARYRLLTAAARDGGCDTLLLAHTRDDQAETLLMRLARGSGIDGLAAMAPMSDIATVDGLDGSGALRLLRPLLAIPKSRLAATLVARRATWIEDPSNRDQRFERIRLRVALAEHRVPGLSAAGLGRTAVRVQRARSALEQWTDDILRSHAELYDGAMGRIGWEVLRKLPEEIALRVLGRLVWTFGGQERPPRLSRLEGAWRAMCGGAETATVGGCVIARLTGDLVVHRELRRSASACVPIAPGPPLHWDRRFRISLTDTSADTSAQSGLPSMLSVGPLGHDGVLAVRRLVRQAGAEHSGMQFAWASPGNVLARVPERAARSLPAIWSASELVAVPHLGRLPPVMALPLPWQARCDCQFVGETRLWGATLG